MAMAMSKAKLELAHRTKPKRTQISAPTIDQLLKALKTLKSEWFTFGVKLGVPIQELKTIESLHKDPERCITEMLQYWLDNKLEAGWNEVILTLEDSDQIVLAQEIKRGYLLTSTEQEGAAQESVSALTPASHSPSDKTVLALPHTMDEITIEADVAVVSNLRRLEASYGHMLVRVSRHLKNCDTTEAITFLDSTVEAGAFDDCENFKQILKKLRDVFEIDIFNTSILFEFAKLFKNAELAQEIEDYEEKKDSFLEETTISEFQRAVVCKVEPIPINERITVTIKIPKEKIRRVTLKNIEELAKNGFNEKSFRQFMCLHARAGCVLVSWIVPKKLSDNLNRLARENAGVFQVNGVVEVTVGGKQVFYNTQQHDIEDSDLKATQVSSSSMTVKAYVRGQYPRGASSVIVCSNLESFIPPLIPNVPEDPNMTPEKLRDLILTENNLVSAESVLLTVSGLPSSGKSPLVVELLGKQFGMERKKLLKVADIKEEEKEFCLFELGAVKDRGSESWHWYQFNKRSRYLACFVSALESDMVQARGKSFEYQPRKQYMFNNEALDNCFHNVYQLLSAFYNDTSVNSGKPIPTNELAGATFSLVNVWDIGFNRAILHFLTLMGGYLHHNFPILTLRYPDDVDHLTELLDISNNELLEGLQPVLHRYSRAQFLLTFSHLGRSFKRERKGVCQVVAIIDPENNPEREQHQTIAEDLKVKITEEARKLGVENLMSKLPWIVDPDNKDDLDALKIKLDDFTSTEEQKDIPLSWFFLRNAFFKTGKLYIKTKKLQKHAEKCRITGDKFKEFLSRFTGFGSIIHIPDIPVFCDYVILNPPDFFHKLTELFYPRYNGDLQYGVASFSTLRRLFGEDMQFFLDVLTSCCFAVEIDSNQIVYADERSRLPIAEPCLYIPDMRTEVAREEESEIHKDSLLLVYKNALVPTRTTENVVKYLFQSKLGAKLCLVTCDCYSITRFAYYPHLKWLMPTLQAPTPPPRQKTLSGQVSIAMVSHGNKNELRITNDEEGVTDIKKEIVRAYRYANKVYSENQQKLLGADHEPEFEFALVCQENPNVLHTITGDTACPECCETEEAYKRMWITWKKVLHETQS